MVHACGTCVHGPHAAMPHVGAGCRGYVRALDDAIKVIDGVVPHRHKRPAAGGQSVNSCVCSSLFAPPPGPRRLPAVRPGVGLLGAGCCRRRRRSALLPAAAAAAAASLRPLALPFEPRHPARSPHDRALLCPCPPWPPDAQHRQQLHRHQVHDALWIPHSGAQPGLGKQRWRRGLWCCIAAQGGPQQGLYSRGQRRPRCWPRVRCCERGCMHAMPPLNVCECLCRCPACPVRCRCHPAAAGAGAGCGADGDDRPRRGAARDRRP